MSYQMFLILKALHLIAVICWFAVLFYLPRLFVYHSMTEDEAGKERFKIMERKLYRAIGTPSIIAVFVFGGWLLGSNWAEYMKSGWVHAKLTLVILLTGYHHVCGAYVKKFARDEMNKSEKFFRIFNEIPVVFLIAIVLLAVVKPF